jgi:hypothetical protein
MRHIRTSKRDHERLEEIIVDEIFPQSFEIDYIRLYQ